MLLPVTVSLQDSESSSFDPAMSWPKDEHPSRQFCRTPYSFTEPSRLLAGGLKKSEGGFPVLPMFF